MKDEAIKAGWQYYYSEILNLEYAVKNGLVVFEDGIKYHETETKKMKNLGPISIKNIHNLKKIFEGVVL